MRLLAIDTALEACSVAVVDMDHATARPFVSSERMARGHAEALIPRIAEIVASAGGFATIDRIAVTVGPGSFTGIRVGLSAARALALALQRPAVGVSTLAALAAPFIEGDDYIPIAVAVDARNDRVFFQMFAPGGRTIVGARCSTVKEAARAAGIGPVKVVGSGAAAIVAAGKAGGSDFRLAEPPAEVPDIRWVAEIGAVADPGAAPARPYYLRPADARPQESGRIARR
jgi:tRNA threonylcarbamoyladenosine biosynthesis protein TsaB